MIRKINWLLFAFLLNPLLGREAQANTINAASCNTGNVQTAINSAAEGDTVIIPPGTCTWTSGVTISGKGITVKGAGSGRIIAYDNGTEVLTIGTGTKTITIAGYSPGFSASSITIGETLTVFENNYRTNFMQGTVTSLVSGVLTMNITSTGGSGSTHRWLIATIPQTVIINNSSTTLFSITEDTSFSTSLSGIQFSVGSNTGCCASYDVSINYRANGQAVLIHDCWMQRGTGQLESIESTTNRGVIWNCSFDGSSYSNSMMATIGAFRTKIDSPQTGQNTWIQPSYWGTADTSGQNNFYVETNDFHAFQATSDNDDNARTVWRYNLMDHAIFSTHGADSSPYGERYFEYYNNTGNFNGYGDGTTFNMANGWIGLVRGGTFIVHDNTLPPISSQDFTKPDIEMTVFDLQSTQIFNASDACWGAGTANGALYHAPRQVGMGRVTGTGLDGKGRSSDETTYVGDTEPVYIWNNNRTFVVGTPDYGGTACANPDHSSNYIVLNRDYFNGTAKPGYTPYTYPHPLTLGHSSGTTPLPPNGLTAAVQ